MMVLVMRSVLLGVIAMVVLTGISAADSIVVDAAKPGAEINQWVLGDNQVAYDPQGIFGGASIDDYSNYGAGLWNPKERKSVGAVIELARNRGLSVSRFPGGCGTHLYNWKQAIGPVEERSHWQFGTDEFLTTCKDMGAEPLITVSYFTGGPQDAADYVEYLNAPDDGAHPWAAKRSANGHPEPYGATYFEFGNEAFHTADHKGLVNPNEYVARFLETNKAMKAVDPTIKFGAIAFNDLPDSAWNEVVFEGVKDHADFIIEHTYSVNLEYFGKPSPVTPRQFAESALAAPLQVERKYKTLNRLIKEKTQRNDLKLAITEYNGALLGDDPVPFRFCLANALHLADIIRVHMQPETHILMANQWQFINETFGSVKGPIKGENGAYVMRPNYWIFWMYHQHFGDTLLSADVSCGAYTTPASCGVLPAQENGREKAEIRSGNLLENMKWTHTPLAGAEVIDENGMLTLRFAPDLKEDYRNSAMVVTGIKPDTTYRISAEVEFSRDIWGARVFICDARGPVEGDTGNTTVWPLPHKGIWTRQHADYKTRSDTTALNIIACRNAKEGTSVVQAAPLTETETIRIRNVQLHEVLPETLPPVPYLSVNASISEDGKKVYLMVINKNLDQAVETPITINGFSPAALRAWVLNGPSFDATNEQVADNVKVEEQPERAVGNGFLYSFEPHSMTALEITANQHSNEEWFFFA